MNATSPFNDKKGVDAHFYHKQIKNIYISTDYPYKEPIWIIKTITKRIKINDKKNIQK